MNKSKVKRQEFKYFINNTDIIILRTLLGNTMLLDNNVDKTTKQYTITSLYFETPNEKDLDQKLDGLLNREKHRLRLYNYADDIIKLETKKRVDTVISKESINITKDISQKIINSDYSIINKENDPLNRTLLKLKSNGYKPRVIVEYEREAYYLPYGNIRITFDKNLRTYNSNTDLFKIKKGINSTSVFLNNYQILEVKYDLELPDYIKDILRTVKSNKSSISKYVLSQILTDQYPWRDYLDHPF